MTRTDSIEEQAADWVLREAADGEDPSVQHDRDQWLEQSMLHRVAYWRLKDAWRRADRLAALRTDKGPLRRHPRLRGGMLAAAVLSVSFLSLSFWWFEANRNALETPVGGRKTVALADGSIIELNTNTKVRISDNGKKRHVDLDKGEAFFQVRHDPKHPFIVIAGNRRIVDLGTKFSVRVDGDDVSVMVQEGRVRVENITHPHLSAPVDLRPNAELIASADTTMLTQLSPKRVDQTLGWRSGMLIFDDETLSDVVAEFNRYNDKKMEISDGEIANTKIAGSFQATNVPAFVRLLRRAFGFQIEEYDEKIIISG